MRGWMMVAMLAAAGAPALESAAAGVVVAQADGGSAVQFVGPGGLTDAPDPFPGFTGGVRVASGDVNGDGALDLIAAPGPGGGPRVTVFSGASGAPLADFFAFDAAFRGGVNVAAGDLNGDGLAEVVAAPASGAGPRVRVFNGGDLALAADFFAFDADLRAGLTLAVGDFGGDGGGDLFAATDLSSRVRVFDGLTSQVRADFFAFAPGAPGGVSLATGRWFGADALFVGAGAGAAPVVRVFALADLALLDSFLAFDAGFAGGVTLAAGPFGGRDALFVGQAARGGTLAAFATDARDPRGAPQRLLASTPFGAAFDGGLSLAAFTPAAAVPEPASWAMLIVGFGLIGAAVRKRRRAEASRAA